MTGFQRVTDEILVQNFSDLVTVLFKGSSTNHVVFKLGFFDPPPPYVATFQIADVVFRGLFLDPPPP